MKNEAKKYRIVQITGIPCPYRIPLYERINRLPGIELLVVYQTLREPERYWALKSGDHSFREVVLRSLNVFIKTLDWSIHISIGLFSILIREAPNAVVVVGYDSLSSWQALIYCKLTGTKFVLWSGTTQDAVRRKEFVFEAMRRIIFMSAYRILAYGTLAKEFLTLRGVKETRIVVGYNTVEMEIWVNKAKRQSIINDQTKTDKFHLLNAGLLIPRKRVEIVLQALSKIGSNDILFTIVGEGSEKEHLSKLAENLHLSEVVNFIPYQKYQDLPPFFWAADAFILPSEREIWGLVVNEALAAGLPVLCSCHLGAHIDLINDKNGIIFDPKKIDTVVAAIEECYMRRDEFQARRSQISDEACKKASIDKLARAFAQAAGGPSTES